MAFFGIVKIDYCMRDQVQITNSAKLRFPVKANLSKLIAQKVKFQNDYFLNQVLVNASFYFLIVNENLEIIFGNNRLLESIGYSKIDDILGLQFGEIFECIYSKERGCGGSDFCKYCAPRNSFRESTKIQKSKHKNFRLVVRNENSVKNVLDLRVAAFPFNYEGEDFLILSMVDISEEKRKEQEERVFLHDILNKAGAVSGFLEIFDLMDNDEERNEILQLMTRGVNELLDEIRYQQGFMQAVNGELVINKKELRSFEILKNLKSDFIYYSKMQNNNIEFMPGNTDIVFMADSVILNRVLTNLVKNALEAVSRGKTISIGSFKEKDNITFKVNNPSVIPQNLQEKIFKRSFSTKGIGRGLGTYSVKIFTEKYLGGKVEFTSSEERGTSFSVTFPVGI